MPTIRLRIDPKAMAVSIKRGIVAALTAVAADIGCDLPTEDPPLVTSEETAEEKTARLVAEGEKGAAEIKDMAASMQKLTDAAKDARKAIRTELGRLPPRTYRVAKDANSLFSVADFDVIHVASGVMTADRVLVVATSGAVEGDTMLVSTDETRHATRVQDSNGTILGSLKKANESSTCVMRLLFTGGQWRVVSTDVRKPAPGGAVEQVSRLTTPLEYAPERERHGEPVPAPAPHPFFHGPDADEIKPLKGVRRIHFLTIVVTLYCSPLRPPQWQDALALVPLFEEAGLLVRLANDVPSFRFELSRGNGPWKDIDGKTVYSRTQLRVECLAEQGMTYEERVQRFSNLLATSPFADKFKCSMLAEDADG